MSGLARLERMAPSWLRLTEPRKGFGIVLFAIVIAVIFQLSTKDTEVTRAIGVAIQAVVIMLALRAAGASHRLIAGTAVFLGLVVLFSASFILGSEDASKAAQRTLTFILILIAPAAIVAGVARELREDERVTIQTIFCGISLYLLLGMAFAFLFGVVEAFGDKPFFAHGEPANPNDLLYFSFATLTTTGYGDFVADTELGRALGVTEALIGQTYLVTVLAVIVSNITPIGRRRRENADR
jgi:hypothetical protein